jgi:hypothetical protein
MRNRKSYVWLWAAMFTFGIIGIPRFLSLFAEISHRSSDGIKEAVALMVLLFHMPFVLALFTSLIFPPRKIAFNRQGIVGGFISASIVISLFTLLYILQSVSYKVPLSFVDLEGHPISDISVEAVWKIEGLTQTTSKTKKQSFTAHNGTLTLEKTKKEVLVVTAHKDGFTYAHVEIQPMHAPYPKGPLQKVDMRWTIGLGISDRKTSASGSKNWSFTTGALQVPVPPSKIPVLLPIKPYTKSNLDEVMPQS